MNIKCYILSIISGTFLLATPGNIASDTVLQGCASAASTTIFCIGLLALFGLGYCVGIDTGIERTKMMTDKKTRRASREN